MRINQYKQIERLFGDIFLCLLILDKKSYIFCGEL
jgi:hypothetical protein